MPVILRTGDGGHSLERMHLWVFKAVEKDELMAAAAAAAIFAGKFSSKLAVVFSVMGIVAVKGYLIEVERGKSNGLHMII